VKFIFIFRGVGYADEKEQQRIRPLLADAKWRYFQGFVVDHVSDAWTTQTWYYRRLLHFGVRF